MKTPTVIPMDVANLTAADYEVLDKLIEEDLNTSGGPVPPPRPNPTPVDPPPTPKPPPVADPKDKPLTTLYQGKDHELTYLDLPEHRRATDTTGAVLGFGRSTAKQKRDVLSQMTIGDQILLLAENNITLSAKSTEKHKKPVGSMSGYRMLEEELKASDESVVRFRALRMMSENSNRIDNYSYSYRKFATNLYKKLAFDGSLGAGVPDIFEFSTSASHKSGVVETGEKIEMHFQASQTIPKVRVVFKKKDISLDGQFVEDVAAACDKDDILELLNLLERNGQFVPLSITLGGRIIISESTDIDSQSAFDTQKNELRVAASGRYVYDGVTIKGDAAAGIGKHDERENTLTDQQKGMTMKLVGGDEREATSETDELGTHWIDTVAPFLGWKTIGFEPKALVPIIDFLDEKYRDKCKEMLRKHFVAHLGIAWSAAAGHESGKKFERDIKWVNRLKSLVVNHEGNVDGMKLNYQVYDEVPGPHGATFSFSPEGKNEIQDKVGKIRGGHDSVVPPMQQNGFNPGETILSLSAIVDTKSDSSGEVLRQVQFTTNEGRKYPSDKGFYGKDKGDKRVEITANRVRGLYGYTGHYLHSIGLMYLKLADNVASRDYMLAMEPYLFPSQNYGVVTQQAPR